MVPPSFDWGGGVNEQHAGTAFVHMQQYIWPDHFFF